LRERERERERIVDERTDEHLMILEEERIVETTAEKGVARVVNASLE